MPGAALVPREYAMPRGSSSLWCSVLGLGFAVAGADKLFGLRAYERMFRHWGWSETGMRLIGAAELACLSPARARDGWAAPC